MQNMQYFEFYEFFIVKYKIRPTAYFIFYYKILKYLELVEFLSIFRWTEAPC